MKAKRLYCFALPLYENALKINIKVYSGRNRQKLVFPALVKLVQTMAETCQPWF